MVLSTISAASYSESKPVKGYKRLATHIQLPMTPTISDDMDFDFENNDHSMDFPSSCNNSGCWPAEDWGNVTPTPADSELKSVFDDWYDHEGDVEICFDEDGAQVIIISSDSPFYTPPTPARPFVHEPFSQGKRSNPNSPVIPLSTTLFRDAPTMEVRISSKRDGSTLQPSPLSPKLTPTPSKNTELFQSAKSAISVLDTSFISDVTTTVNLANLTSSWRSPHLKKALPWIPKEEDADDPWSAIAFSPTDLLGHTEMHFVIRAQPSGV